MSEITLPEVPSATLRVVVNYLYSGSLNIEDLAGSCAEIEGEKGKLAADGFVAVQAALHLCGIWCLDHLSVLIECAVLKDLGGDIPTELAPAMLLLADSHRANFIRAHALRTIKRHWNFLSESPSFHDLPDCLKNEVRICVESLIF